uniref:DUF3385 domain-containing protein n=1 Tax=Gongylonema pulchrum TaxID=637853 RepID=A0A183EPK0_9BILA
LSVLQCFKDGDAHLLSHLAQADMLQLIFMTLHDEKLEMQERSVALLGKLGNLNPAYVLPKKNYRLEEHSARLIAQVAKQSPKFIKPYMSPILAALVPMLRTKTNHVDVIVQVLNAISELAVAGGPELVFSVETLFPSLVQFLQDSSSLSRRENTAYVVDPYKDYPELLDVLLRLLRTEMSASMRRMTMRVSKAEQSFAKIARDCYFLISVKV